MPIIRPDTWIASVLQAGSEKFLAGALYAGWKVGRIYDSLARRFGIPEAASFQNLLDFGESMVEAGRIMQSLPAGGVVPRELMPIQPYLFGNQPAGRRELWRVSAHLADIGTTVYSDIAFPEPPTREGIDIDITTELPDYVRKYPAKFGLGGFDLGNVIEVGYIFGEARF